MEHSVDCRLPDVLDVINGQTCLSCGSVDFANQDDCLSEDPPNTNNNNASELGEEDEDILEDQDIRYTSPSPQYDVEEGDHGFQYPPRLNPGLSTTDFGEAFDYRTINQKEELRLLRIQQGSRFDDPIQCTLIHETLRQLLPPFEAISYMWADASGNSAKEATILINSKSFQVTANCERVLRRIRLKSRSRLVWVDAICIDQNSETEKTHQVQLMAQIYARANRVLIYVGEARNRRTQLL